MLKLIDLATRPDFHAGPLLVSPSRRLVRGPAGETTVEPLVMKAFILLLDARGGVVTRAALFDTCWGQAVVGDDSLNRAIAQVRRIARDTGPGLFEIIAVPRTGYQLTGEIVGPEDETPSDPAAPAHNGMPRRAVLGTAGAVALAAAAGGGLWISRQRTGQRFDDLMERGRLALAYGHPSRNPAPFFAQAVQLRPDDAKANGLLALSYAYNVENGDPAQTTNAVSSAEQAARATLAIQPSEPNASLALIILQSSMMDLITTEDRLLQVLRTDPENIQAMRVLWGLYQSTGRSRDCFALIERAIAIQPLAPANNYPRAQLLWILGRTAEADRVIDRALKFWPDHPFVRFARFIIFAFTGRASAALEMLNDDDRRPQSFSPQLTALWRVALPALGDPTPANVAAARDACLRRGRSDPPLAYQGMMMLSALGEVDAAFALANDFLLFRTPVAATISRAPPVRSTSWRFAPGLFTPPTAAMRADPRFKALCDGIGLTDYWRKRGIRPDYQVGGS